MYVGFKTLTPATRILVSDILNGTDNFSDCPVEEDNQYVKVSSKGIQKNNNLTQLDFLQVLKTKVAKEGVNRGFRGINQKLYTIEETRRGPDYCYRKRRVLPCGIRTVRLLEPDEL